MTCNENNGFTRELVGDSDGSPRVALVVPDLNDQPFAQDTALGVDIVNGLFRTSPHLISKCRIQPRHWPCDTNHEVIGWSLGSWCGARCDHRHGNQT